jgi:hypothetical protein
MEVTKTSVRSLGTKAETRDPSLQNMSRALCLYQYARSLMKMAVNFLNIHILICIILLSIYFHELISRRKEVIIHLYLCLIL